MAGDSPGRAPVAESRRAIGAVWQDRHVTETRNPRPAFDNPAFWANCFLDEYADELPGRPEASDFEGGEADQDDEDEVDSSVTAFDLGDGYVLSAETGYGCAMLNLSHPGAAEPVEIAWDDQAHWHPHALRWSEVDAVCRASALDSPDAAYPGPYLALLGRFAPVCDEADAALAVPLLREAFALLPGLDPFQRGSYAAHWDMRGARVRWTLDEPTGWWFPEQGSAREERESGVLGAYDQDPDLKDLPNGELYSMRDPDEPDFPFAALAELVDLARARCAAVREREWAAHASVQAAAETFAGDATAANRAALLGALGAAGCPDQAVLSALAPDAGDLRALVMTEMLLGSEPGSLVRAHAAAGPVPRPPRRYDGHAFIPVPEDNPRDPFAQELKPRLNAALRAAGLGTVQNGPARIGRGERTFHDLNLHLLNDWHAALEVVRAVMLEAGAPAGSSVAVYRRGEHVEVKLDRPLPRD